MPRPEWSDERLDAARLVGDPAADAAVAAVYASGQIEAVSALLQQVIRNDGLVPADLPPEIRGYLESTSSLPEWADHQRIRRGEALFMEHGPLALVSLLCASLPACYVNGPAVQVIWTTQELERHATRRLYETAQMVVDVMSRGGLEPTGKGIRAAQRVRLMHAGIRHLLLSEDDAKGPPRDLSGALLRTEWNPAWGTPINQEDLAYTLLTFSHVILRSLERLGARVSEMERVAFIHCWNVVGSVMGIRDDLLAHSPAEASELFDIVDRRHAARTDAGVALTAALLAAVCESVPTRVLRHAPHLISRHLVGSDTATKLEIADREGFEDSVADAAIHGIVMWERVVGRFADSLSITRWAGTMLGQELVTHLTRIPRGWNRGLFAIPQDLHDAWGTEPAAVAGGATARSAVGPERPVTDRGVTAEGRGPERIDRSASGVDRPS